MSFQRLVQLVQLTKPKELRALLKEHPELAKEKDEKGWTALHYAAARRPHEASRPKQKVVSQHHNVISILLEYKADPTARNQAGDTPLMQACRDLHFCTAEHLARVSDTLAINDEKKDAVTLLNDARVKQISPKHYIETDNAVRQFSMTEAFLRAKMAEQRHRLDPSAPLGGRHRVLGEIKDYRVLHDFYRGNYPVKTKYNRRATLDYLERNQNRYAKEEEKKENKMLSVAVVSSALSPSVTPLAPMPSSETVSSESPPQEPKTVTVSLVESKEIEKKDEKQKDTVVTTQAAEPNYAERFLELIGTREGSISWQMFRRSMAETFPPGTELPRLTPFSRRL